MFGGGGESPAASFAKTHGACGVCFLGRRRVCWLARGPGGVPRADDRDETTLALAPLRRNLDPKGEVRE